MLGYKFEIEENCNNFLNVLLSNINLNKYYVFIKEDEIIPDSISSLDDNSLFRNSVYKYLDFSKELESKKYQSIFMRIDFSKSDISKEEISSPKEYLQSSIEMLIIVTDSIYGEVYCKNQGILSKILVNLRNSKSFKEIKKVNIGNRKTLSSYTD